MKKYVRELAVLLVFMLVLTGCGPTNSQKNTEDNKNPQSEMQSEQNKETEETENTTKDTQEQETEEDTQDSQVGNETEIKLYAKTNVNVRSLPSTNGEKLGALSMNQEVIALGEAVDGWQKIRYEGDIAYVSAQYLSKTKVQSQSSQTQMQVDEITAEDLTLPADFDPDGIVVVIDAGHQGKMNSGKEPDGPGSTTMKTKVSAGTTGCATGVNEYVLNLEVSLKLRDELKARGYQVVMIREDHNINISNSERAKFANKLGADAFIRIHANSTTSSSVKGVETICQTANNPYNASLYQASRKLSDCVLDEFVKSTGAKKRHVWETDTMSGINWCQVPVTILEMGFMSNPEEDQLLNTEEYQDKMVEGIANGIDKYFGR